MQADGIIQRINKKLARNITLAVGTMWAFYVFVIFGLSPLFWPNHEEQILYWSNFLQLVFLPIITVGTSVINEKAEKRFQLNHEWLKKVLDMEHEDLVVMAERHDKINKKLEEISAELAKINKK